MKWYGKLIVILALIGAVVFIVEHKKRQGFTCSASGGICPLPTKAETQTVATVEADLEKPLPRLLDLGAGKCVPCKMMEPILDELKKTFAGQMTVDFIDVWKDQAAGQRYGIRMIPTQIFYDAEGNELFRHEGFFAREDILKKWNELGIHLEMNEETPTNDRKQRMGTEESSQRMTESNEWGRKSRANE